MFTTITENVDSKAARTRLRAGVHKHTNLPRETTLNKHPLEGKNEKDLGIRDHNNRSNRSNGSL
ncbi:MAG: hypothetical protein KF767_09370 [Bdellovibrionaceae bacterium]|nr:hypothetical protein [Pseudobdellovibrionaceae bacterium]